jgi:hypothetical protein
MSSVSALPWPDLQAPNDFSLQSALVAEMRPDLRETICSGLRPGALASSGPRPSRSRWSLARSGLWRGAYQRQCARKGKALPAVERVEMPGCSAPEYAPLAALLIREARHLVSWALEVLELPAGGFLKDARFNLLLCIFSRVSWLDRLLARVFGSLRSLYVWDAALDELLPAEKPAAPIAS